MDATNTADFKQKHPEEREQIDEIVIVQPNICFDVFFREMVYRLLQTIGASRDRMHNEYEKTREGQYLTQLGNELYVMRDTQEGFSRRLIRLRLFSSPAEEEGAGQEGSQYIENGIYRKEDSWQGEVQFEGRIGVRRQKQRTETAKLAEH